MGKNNLFFSPLLTYYPLEVVYTILLLLSYYHNTYYQELRREKRGENNLINFSFCS
jgi:hypothetical protein